MKKLKSVLTAENIITGYLYFYVHFVVEVICFFCLARIIGDGPFLWISPFIYDALAFVPQSIIGYASDKFPKIRFGLIGILLMVISVMLYNFNLNGYFIALILLCLGNACLHVDGAEVTLRSSKGKLSHSAIFVSGGSFGVITGKLLGKTAIPYWGLAVLALTMIPFVLLGNMYRDEMDEDDDCPCNKFNYHNEKISPGLVVLFAVLVVIVRGYMGYGIPTAWNKTVFQTILLYCFMGTGKALGGILSDMFGVKRMALFSIIFALPFLLIGDNLMVVSLIGVLFFSMTMAITLALLTSVLKYTPGLAFGLTTVGLFLGTVPIFFIKFTTTLSNCVIIFILTILCVFIVNRIIRKDVQND